jgi:RNA polymerase sigma-70 factor (ECF subfamily)
MASPSAPPATGEVQQRCAELFAARGERLQRFAQRLLGADAPDGVQEVFAAACRSLPSFRGESQLTTWFHRLAVRVLCAFRRRRDARAVREQPDAEAEARLSPRALAAYQQSPFDLCAQAERRARVLAALDRLSPPLREVLLLRGEGLSYSEIAQALAIPPGTVKSRMAAATVLLAEKLQRHEEDER